VAAEIAHDLPKVARSLSGKATGGTDHRRTHTRAWKHGREGIGERLLGETITSGHEPSGRIEEQAMYTERGLHSYGCIR